MSERQESGRKPHIVAAVRREVLNEGKCAYCGERFFPLTVDHIMPLSRGGTDSRSNLTAACWPCNSEKLTFTPEEWREWRQEMGYPWPPQSKSGFIMEHLRAQMPQEVTEEQIQPTTRETQP
jgi:hypothetical protein